MSRIGRILARARRTITHPIDELSRSQRRVRYLVELMRHCFRQLWEDKAEQMAAALTFRTVFALVPLFVLGLIVFRVFGGSGQIQEELEEPLFKAFGVFEVPSDGYAPGVPEGDEASGPGPDDAPAMARKDPKPEVALIEVLPLENTIEEKQAARGAGDEPNSPRGMEREAVNKEQVRVSLRKVLNDAIGNFYALDFSTVGLSGLALFIYAALAWAVSVEYDFNLVFKAPTARPWHLRLPIYWSVITLGIALVAITFWLTGAIQERIEEVIGPGWGILNYLFAFLISWGLLFLLYLLMPNVLVRVKPALLGAFVAALLWEIGKIGFQKYINVAVPYSAFYGTLGLVPLFLFWIYLSWLIVLFGLELTHALQAMHGRWRTPAPRSEEEDFAPAPSSIVGLVAAVGEAFGRGESVTEVELATRLTLPLRAIHMLCQHLVGAGILHRVDRSEGEREGLSLALPPERILINRLLDLDEEFGPDASAAGLPAQSLMKELREGRRRLLDGRSLADVLPGPGDRGA